MRSAIDAAARVPTTAGWRDAGELRAGEEVFSADGLPAKVTAVRELKPLSEVAIELRLCDGSALVCGASQPWLVAREEVVELLEAGEIASLLRQAAPPRISLPLAAPLERRYAELPEDPYAEGARLGSGMLEEAYRIPRRFLEGDVIQRRELLMGLLDEGGGVSSSGAVHFDTVHSHLARDVCELVRSLGWRATTSSGGVPCGHCRRVSFRTVEMVFGLREPAERLRELGGDVPDRRFIIDAVEAGWRPMVAIGVETVSSLFACGDGLLVTPSG